MSEPHPQTKYEFWLKHVTAWRTSGLLQTAYSRQHNLNATTFNNWVRRIRQETGIACVPSLTTVPITIRPDNAAPPASPVNLQHHRGWQLSLSSDVCATWLAQLLNGLA